MINKKLFETIIGFKVFEFEQDNNTVSYYPASYVRNLSADWQPELISINIYELANKAKVWASLYGQGNPSKYPFYMWTGIDHNDKWSAFITEFKSFCIFTPVTEQSEKVFCSYVTEPEAIFAACQYILDNK